MGQRDAASTRHCRNTHPTAHAKPVAHAGTACRAAADQRDATNGIVPAHGCQAHGLRASRHHVGGPARRGDGAHGSNSGHNHRAHHRGRKAGDSRPAARQPIHRVRQASHGSDHRVRGAAVGGPAGRYHDGVRPCCRRFQTRSTGCSCGNWGCGSADCRAGRSRLRSGDDGHGSSGQPAGRSNARAGQHGNQVASRIDR